MKRNRSIRTLPLDNLKLLKHPIPEAVSHDNLYFGEEITKQQSVVDDGNRIITSDDSDLILTNVRDLGSKSSSSSLSWGEEYKTEALCQIRNELERMDRVLRGAEHIPSNYDEEEYKEWMEFFPNLCVFGMKTGTYSNSVKRLPHFEEFLAIHPKQVCDKSELKEVKPPLKKSVITASDNTDVDTYLRIEGSRLPRRLNSSRSLISSQISSSKWLKDDEYGSLPFLTPKKGRNGSKKGILKHSLVLPPIDSSPFRSISATPRREGKSLSALSVKDKKISGLQRRVL